jgi:hypothetical protein
VAPVGTPAAAQAAVTPAANAVNADDAEVIDDEPVPLAVNEEDDNTTEADTMVEIEDEETPLAAAEENPTKTGRGGLLAGFAAVVAAIAGKTAYDKKNKKNLFAEKEKEDK